MLLAAHQANFIPWLPYFDKMNKADIFVMMINCQFEKNGWQNRCEVWDRK
ncbi:MAG: WbqC family protein [Nitrospinae bacterium]|nr:WbqC family protein [Nitrospinota bacterium]